MRRLFLLVAGLFVCGAAAVFSVPSLTYAKATTTDSILQKACDSGNTADSPTCSTTSDENPLTGPNGMLLKISRFIAILAGIAAIIVIIISGMRYITSAGDTQKVAGAQKSLIGAIIGLVIIALAQIIVEVVVKGFL